MCGYTLLIAERSALNILSCIRVPQVVLQELAPEKKFSGSFILKKNQPTKVLLMSVFGNSSTKFLSLQLAFS